MAKAKGGLVKLAQDASGHSFIEGGMSSRPHLPVGKPGRQRGKRYDYPHLNAKIAPDLLEEFRAKVKKVDFEDRARGGEGIELWAALEEAIRLWLKHKPVKSV